ncbi:MAG TPA: TfpX/TfpZ family type IV pilin accessory protein [Steroidobacteraceae bacterium]
MAVWQEKFRAFGIHLAVTLLVAAVAAALFFGIWFRDPFDEMLGGLKLLLLLIGCDVALGPLISLVIYNSRKPRRQLVFDYTLVGIVQLAALVYGMTVSFNARPVYVVFATDRLEVITAAEIAPQDLKEARLEQFRELPVWGPALAAARVEEKDQQDALDWALAGKDITVRPKFFVPYADELPKIKARMRPLSELRRATEDPLVAKKLAEASESTMWLPVQHKNGFWTALVDSATALPIDYIPLDPYDAISRVSRRQ